MLEHLNVFITVARAGNFSAAAKQLDVVVSSVTRRVSALEAELNIKLFRRTSRGVMLTDAGEKFLTSAKNILAEMEYAKEALSDGEIEPRGLLTVAASTSFGRRHVAPVVTSFLRKYPQIEIDLLLSDQLVDFSTQRVDVAIRMGALPDSDLVATKLAPLRRLFCASPDYINQFGIPSAPEDLLSHNCLTENTRPIPKGWWSFPGVNGGEALHVKGSLRTDDKETLLYAAINGVGIVHLPSWLVGDMLEEGRLVSIFPMDFTNEHKQQAGIYAVRLPGRSHAAKAQLFIAHLKQEFGNPVYWDRWNEK